MPLGICIHHSRAPESQQHFKNVFPAIGTSEGSTCNLPPSLPDVSCASRTTERPVSGCPVALEAKITRPLMWQPAWAKGKASTFAYLPSSAPISRMLWVAGMKTLALGPDKESLKCAHTGSQGRLAVEEPWKPVTVFGLPLFHISQPPVGRTWPE